MITLISSKMLYLKKPSINQQKKLPTNKALKSIEDKFGYQHDTLKLRV